MDLLHEVEIDCPYCGESIDLLVDCSAGSQTYVEDCAVCCRPMTVDVTLGSIVGQDTEPEAPSSPALSVSVRREDD